LSGVVEPDQLRNLVDGLHPLMGEPLLSGRARSVRAFDVTFSAPKSVSLLWALGSGPVAEVVAAAHREAAAEALGFLEERAAVARQQSGGVRRRVRTQGFVVAGFVHRTSREGDPQLHSHCLIPNLVERTGDGKVVAFDAGPLFEWGRAAGSIYQNHLQRSLALRLGVEWVRIGTTPGS
jgi:conjugative relaxase-like TrwC/TraI family protein